MAKQITQYTANVTGISANNIISSASEITARQNSATAINNTGEVVAENRALLEAIHTTDHIVNVISTSFTGGTNELAILANAITWWDQSVYTADKTATALLTGWPAKTITGLTSSGTFYIWATFVSGTKDYEATNITAALPSNITEKALIGIATVSGAGAVTFAINWQGPTQTRENYFRDAQYFQNNVSLLGGVTNQIRTVTANYTALTTDSIILCNATSGNITITLYTAVGNAGRKLTIIKTDSSTNTVTIDGNSTETINGSLTQVLFTQHSTLTLVSNGTNWQIENGQLNRVLLNETVVSSAVASVNFTSLITSTFKKYTIELINIISVTNDVNLLLRTSSNNGSSWDAGTGYSTQGLLVASTTATNSISLSNTAYSAILLTLDAATGRLSNSATQGGLSSTIDLYNPSSTTAIKHFKHLTSYAPSGTTSYTIYGGGTRQTTSAINAVQIICSSGNIASGTLKLYGEN